MHTTHRTSHIDKHKVKRVWIETKKQEMNEEKEEKEEQEEIKGKPFIHCPYIYWKIYVHHTMIISHSDWKILYGSHFTFYILYKWFDFNRTFSLHHIQLNTKTTKNGTKSKKKWEKNGENKWIRNPADKFIGKCALFHYFETQMLIILNSCSYTHRYIQLYMHNDCTTPWVKPECFYFLT